MTKDTHGFADPFESVDGNLKRAPDLVVYPNSDDAAAAYTLPPAALAKHLKTFKTEQDIASEKEKVARTVWHWATLLFEVKSNKYDSPFSDRPLSSNAPVPESTAPTSPPLRDPPSVSQALPSSVGDMFSPPPGPWTSGSGALASDASILAGLRVHLDRGRKTMGQLTEHAFKMMRRGSRLCVFSVFVCRELAWLLRWDRAGVVVSEPFNLLEQPKKLHDFLYRFANMTDEQRGFDPTVAFASKEEVELLRSPSKAGLETPWQQAAFANTLPKGWPVYTIKIPETDFIPPSRLTPTSDEAQNTPSPSSSKTLKLIVGMAYFASNSITGRATKCYLAYDITENRVVFCKEYWRVDLPESHPEGDVYVDLHEHGVECIPTPIAAGDVRHGQNAFFSTRTQEFLPDNLPRLIFYRLLLKEIAEPLERYTTSYQLASILLHCVIGSFSSVPRRLSLTIFGSSA